MQMLIKVCEEKIESTGTISLNLSGKPYKDIDEYLDLGRLVHVVPHMFRQNFVSILASEKVLVEARSSLVGHGQYSKGIEPV